MLGTTWAMGKSDFRWFAAVSFTGTAQKIPDFGHCLSTTSTICRRALLHFPRAAITKYSTYTASVVYTAEF